MTTATRDNSKRLAAIGRNLAKAAGALPFGGAITHVYNPLDYAWAAHRQYINRFGHGKKEAVLLGMNPGPFGMAQTGIPFGDVVMVRDWMGIDAPIKKPAAEHPKRPVDGFACKRREVSGSRLWGWARMRFGRPEAFFDRFYVINYCPLAFLEASGRNFTPDKLPAAERSALTGVCDMALRDMAAVLQPAMIIGVGQFAQKRARDVFGDALPIGLLPHPSPASPAANRGWDKLADNAMRENGIAIA